MHSCLFLSNLYQFSTWFLLQYLTISTTSQYNQKKKKNHRRPGSRWNKRPFPPPHDMWGVDIFADRVTQLSVILTLHDTTRHDTTVHCVDWDEEKSDSQLCPVALLHRTIRISLVLTAAAASRATGTSEPYVARSAVRWIHLLRAHIHRVIETAVLTAHTEDRQRQGGRRKGKD